MTGQQSLFLSTPSVGRATTKLTSPSITTLDFYPRPPWGGRHKVVGLYNRYNDISIHALRGEGDAAPLGELADSVKFLSTPSVGRATQQGTDTGRQEGISIHALRGEGDNSHDNKCTERNHFYPRPPWGGRLVRTGMSIFRSIFLSTPSVGRATTGHRVDEAAEKISIHALRGEGDLSLPPSATSCQVFLSTPSVGRATQYADYCKTQAEFLSTPSVGRATECE